ncbi:MAG TPA: hypothetical protein VMU79_12335 [Casimicrobiaceae bacterium]|jgi:hypothetical protein|nr:hypothetical protein [Casimicrobiaceae bacterium]
MQPTQLYARLRARLAAGVGQFRDTLLPRYNALNGSMQRMSSTRKSKREPSLRQAPPH